MGELHFRGNPAPVLNGVLGHLAGVRGRAAGQHDDLGDALQVLGVNTHLVERELAVQVVAAQEGLGHGVRLVVDFLLHKGGETTLFRRGRVPVHVVFLALGRGAEEIGDRHGVRGDGHDLVLAQFHRPASVVNEAGNVRAEEILPVTQAHHERRVAPGGHDDVGLVRVHGQQREGAFEPLAGKLHGFRQTAVGGIAVQLVAEDVADQRRGHLGVRLGREHSALFEQFELELGEVFDDAVVDQGQLAAVGQVRVSIHVRGPAVRGPAGVPDSGDRIRQR
ncbi:hypothetical protein D9M72_328170 [compost metagenome]